MNKIEKNSKIEEKCNLITNKNTFSSDKLKEYLKEINIKFPYIVYSQSKLETGNFTSKIFKENNNLFGMRVATKRTTTSKGSKNNYAYYNTWEESVLDYALYQSKISPKIKTEEDYLDYLRDYYSLSPNYIEHLSKIIKQEKENW